MFGKYIKINNTDIIAPDHMLAQEEKTEDVRRRMLKK